jgi:hypothetical protein
VDLSTIPALPLHAEFLQIKLCVCSSTAHTPT